MFGSFAKNLFGSSNDRAVKAMQPLVQQINAREADFAGRDDDALRKMLVDIRKEIVDGASKDAFLVDVFALVREAAKRTLGQRHFDVQIMGGIALHRGQIAEMKTGEGKTLVATLAVVLNALDGRGVHVVTVNDYLASRDAAWMSRVYNFLGLTVGCIIGGLDDGERRAAYACDVTYGTNNEFGFDYLRDNLKFTLDEMVQRDFSFAIVDEVDSILIDEARTPLIISGPAESNSEHYMLANQIVPILVQEDYDLDEKGNSVSLSEVGIEHAETLLRERDAIGQATLFDTENVGLLHHVNQALRAHKLFARDTHYMVKDGQVVIIDEFTGRAMEGRRFSDGLHQAVEAKERLQISCESRPLARITRQRFFRKYSQICGITGTTSGCEKELAKNYGTPVLKVPNRLPSRREHWETHYSQNQEQKQQAIVAETRNYVDRRRAVLIGTPSIAESHAISKLLAASGITHRVLNGVQDAQEAEIIADAGQCGAVTVATNMAGRGTDIQLEPQLAADGGLHVIVTQMHSFARVDRQLIGRCARCGDPGSFRIFVASDDPLPSSVSPWIGRAIQRLAVSGGAARDSIQAHLESAQKKQERVAASLRWRMLQADRDAQSLIRDNKVPGRCFSLVG